MKYLSATFRITDRAGTKMNNSALLQTVKDIICSYAGEAGFESFEENEDSVTGYIQTALFDNDVLSAYIKDIPVPDIRVDYSVREAEDKNWNETWEGKGFEPILIDGKCVVHDKLHVPDTVADGILDITIDTKQAFGTGTHETTYMIINELFNFELNNKSVLDCGCGTGILSIMASKMGSSRIVGYDIDEWSVNNTEHNCRINKVSNVEAIHGDCSVIDSFNNKFDVVLANINRNILLADLPSFKKAMNTGAVLLLSGFYENDAKLLIDKAATLNLAYVSKSTRNNWCLLELVNKDQFPIVNLRKS